MPGRLPNQSGVLEFAGIPAAFEFWRIPRLTTDDLLPEIFSMRVRISSSSGSLNFFRLCLLQLAATGAFAQSPVVEVRDIQPAPLWQRIDHIVGSVYFGPAIPLASDPEFQRRVYLDLIGRGPTVAESESFLDRIQASAETSELMRQELIDDLLSRDEFAHYYAKVLEVMFSERREVIGLLEVRAFIRQWLTDRRPLNELCTEMLAADGTGEDLRAAASFLINRHAEPHLVTRDVGRIFFGRDVQCAQCHDHPLVSDYEQSEYYGILSFVNRTYVFKDEKRGNFPYLGEKGEGSLEFASVFRPEAGKSVAQPMLPMAMAMDAEPDFVDSVDAYVVAPEKDQRGIPRYSRRQQLAVLATHPENQSFNRNLANRLWANMMGMGVVHPVDMHHSDNPPVSAALLRLLSEELVTCQYDLREILRQIAFSRTYQRSVVAPDLSQWTGPDGGVEGLQAELATLAAEQERLAPHLESLQVELKQANNQLEKSQADVAKLQLQGEEAKKQYQQLIEKYNQGVAELTALQARQTKQQQLVDSLQATLKEADRILQLTPDDQELRAAHALLNTRLVAANEAKPALDNEVQEQQGSVEDALFRAEDQRNRIRALANRRLALGEFVVEARGVQRGVRKRIQAGADAQADCEQQQLRIEGLQKWLTLRDQLRQLEASGSDTNGTGELRVRFKSQTADLEESWRRSYAIRRIRGLTPEQLAGATYYALEMDQPARVKAEADWEASHQDDAAERDHAQKRESFVTAALCGNIWDTVEDLIVTRFSAPAGAPQDGFFATVDQALMIQNDPTYQSWLKANNGNLIQRLVAMEEPHQLASQLYRCILGRTPDVEEVEMVGQLLNQYAAERATIVQELVWGLLASSEFRFSM